MAYEAIILAAAKAANISGKLLLAVCMYESNLKNVLVPVDVNSPTYGICQVKYETAKMMGFTGQPLDLMKPAVNAKWAAEYLRYQLDRYDRNWCMSVAAYNAGTFNESERLPGYPRNLKYVRRVQKKLEPDLQHRLSCGREVAEK